MNTFARSNKYIGASAYELMNNIDSGYWKLKGKLFNYE